MLYSFKTIFTFLFYYIQLRYIETYLNGFHNLVTSKISSSATFPWQASVDLIVFTISS